MSIFDYTQPELPDDCRHIISPSLIYKFFDYPRLWYEEVMLGKEGFKGNTASVTGTICHRIYEQVGRGHSELDREAINRELNEYLSEAKNDEIEASRVKNDWPPTAMAVVNQYVLPNAGKGLLELEKQVALKVADGIYLAGTCDRIEGDCVVDFKTVAVRPNEKEIPFGYKIQTLAYAYALRHLGYEINRIRIVYGVKPTKTLPARCIVVTEEIDFTADKLIGDTIKLIADTIQFAEQNPQYNYLLFKSYELKEK